MSIPSVRHSEMSPAAPQSWAENATAEELRAAIKELRLIQLDPEAQRLLSKTSRAALDLRIRVYSDVLKRRFPGEPPH